MFSSLTSYLWGSNTPQPSDESKNDLYDALNADSVNNFVNDLSAMEIGSSDDDEPKASKEKKSRTTKDNDEWIFIDDEKLGLRRVKKNDTWFKVPKRNFAKPLPRNHVMKKYGRRFNNLYQNTDRRAYAKYCTEQNKLDPTVSFADKVKAWQIEDKNSGEQISEVIKPVRPKKLRVRPVSLTDGYSEDTKERIRQSVRLHHDVDYDWKSVSRVKGAKKDTQHNTSSYQTKSNKILDYVDPEPEFIIADDDIEEYIRKGEKSTSEKMDDFNEQKEQPSREKPVNETVEVAEVPREKIIPSPQVEKVKPIVIEKTRVGKKITTAKPVRALIPDVSPTQTKVINPKSTYGKVFTAEAESFVTPTRLFAPTMSFVKRQPLETNKPWSDFCRDSLWPFSFLPKMETFNDETLNDFKIGAFFKKPSTENREGKVEYDGKEHPSIERVLTRSETKSKFLEQKKRLLAMTNEREEMMDKLREKRITMLKKYMNHYEEPQMRKKKTVNSSVKEPEPNALPDMFKDPSKEQKEKENKEREDRLVTRSMVMTQKSNKREERKKMTRKSIMSSNRARATASAGNGRQRRADRMNHTVCARSNNNRKIH